MLKIFNIRTYGIIESLRAAGYPMMEGEIEELPEINTVISRDASDDAEFPCYDSGTNDTWVSHEEFDALIKRGIKLGTVPTGTGHDNFLKGIVVQFDVMYPQYWSPQFQRYHFADIVSSTSKMHRLAKMDIKKSCNKYVDRDVINNLNCWIDIYNHMIDKKLEKVNVEFDTYDGGHYVTDKEATDAIDKTGYPIREFSKYEVFMKIISNTPMGFEQTMRVTTNYLQLKTIYLQREHHKLKEDWGAFIDFCNDLPYFRELCLKEEK